MTTVGVVTSATVASLTNGTMYTFTVAALSAAGTGASSTASAAVTPNNGFTVSVVVSGLTTAGLVLADNVTDTLNMAANGIYTFGSPIQTAAACAVTLKTQPSGTNQCFVSNGSGKMGTSNVSVTVPCGVSTCAILKAANANAASGPYTISPNGTTALPVYCDMATDGGGWTLLSWTGDSAASPHGIPYPGLAYCSALNCAGVSDVTSATVATLYNHSKEFATSSSTSAQTSFTAMAGYPLIGKWTYASLSGLTETPVTTCTSFAAGTFTSILDYAATAAPVYLAQSLVYFNSSPYYDFFLDTNSYIWSVGEQTSCNANGTAPGSYLGTWNRCNWLGNGDCTAGSFAVWVRSQPSSCGCARARRAAGELRRLKGASRYVEQSVCTAAS